jgi:hypothetical protein
LVNSEVAVLNGLEYLAGVIFWDMPGGVKPEKPWDIGIVGECRANHLQFIGVVFIDVLDLR